MHFVQRRMMRSPKTMAKAPELQPHVTLDMKGTACPGPLMGAKRILDELSAGEMMVLISDCPGTGDDLSSWCRYIDVEVMKAEELERGATVYYIRKGKTPRISPNAVLDMRGATCPGPIVEAKKLLNGMRKGEVLQLMNDCPGIMADVLSWVQATGVELADTRESAPGDYQFLLRRR